ncbi:GLUG motif-containing protein [Desulfonatronum sp. SC1]|uniref:GLUG motif-containing protein n=1 Tax=Desulfonatronum sp. SC1 TaxID=2109626 RepID=UPI000D32553D|nr:GLUG motif-containing protein [Desulfonatronum sp. SC1]PTN32228.1 hypothetical protein C6366_16760 [Desulfonatronum sp. SC1]
MNKALSLVLTTLFFLTLTGTALAQTATAPAAGDGSPGNPYQIATLENLYWIAAPDAVVPLPNRAARWAAHYIQTADIDASATSGWDGGAGWTPIGGQFPAPYFTGTYDGGGYTISGLFINRPGSDFQGLFGFAENATIKNLGLIGVNITGANNVGGLVGAIQGFPGTTVSNSYATGAVNGADNVGGLVGWIVGGSVSNSYATGAVNGTTSVGGLVGLNSASGTVTNSYATGAVNGTVRVGGLVGWNAGIVTNSYATGAVAGGGADVGGLVGLNPASGTVTKSFYDRNTTGQSDTGKGTPKTTAQMKDIATFSAWSIVDGWEQANGNVWGICQSASYPFLLWQYSSNPCTYSLSVRSFGASYVSITATPGIYGGTTNYAKAGILFGTTITLTAPATKDNSNFTSWRGCNSTNQSARTCTVTMNGNRTVTAHYDGDTPKALPGVLMLLLDDAE